MGTNQGSQRKISSPQLDPELQKYIRIQTAGMAIFLSWPVAMMLAAMYGLDGIIPAISVVMIMVAMIIFFIGLVGRQELKEQRDKETKGK